MDVVSLDQHKKTNMEKILERKNDFKLLVYNSSEKYHITQLTFICSESTIETVKKGVKYVQS